MWARFARFRFLLCADGVVKVLADLIVSDEVLELIAHACVRGML